MIRPITLRLPVSVYERIKQMATQRGISFNALVEESLVARIEAEERVRLFEAFTEVGGSGEETDVEFALVAQRETTESPGV
jgi:hypothetical protein